MCWNPVVGRRNLYLISIIGRADCSGRTDALNLEFPQQGFLHQVFLCPVFLFKTSKMYSKLDQVYCAWLIISVVKRDKVNIILMTVMSSWQYGVRMMSISDPDMLWLVWYNSSTSGNLEGCYRSETHSRTDKKI